MAEEFKAITTQEAFDAAIKERLERNTRSVTEEVKKQFEGYQSPDDAKKAADQIAKLTQQLADQKQTAADLTAKVHAHEAGSVTLHPFCLPPVGCRLRCASQCA